MLRDDNINIPAPNSWTVIGGCPDMDETPLQTLIREVKEETNIDLIDVEFLLKYHQEEGLKYVYTCKLNKEQIASIKLGDEGQDLKFFTLEEIQKLRLARTTEIFFDKYLKSIKKQL
jgi:8-oxo-dGTP pyrophosphatase MutT (NUDIX family)